MPAFKEGDPDRLPFQPEQTTRAIQPAPSPQEQQGWYDRPHSALVDAFKDFIRQKQQRLGAHTHYFPPENIIRTELYLGSRSGLGMKKAFFTTLLHAWDAVAFDRYDLADADASADSLNRYSYKPYSRETRPSVTLSDPLQVKMIDALTEAAGIPHEKEQTEIPIPQRLRGNDYWQWRSSPQYEQECTQRLARAQSRKGNQSEDSH